MTEVRLLIVRKQTKQDELFIWWTKGDFRGWYR